MAEKEVVRKIVPFKNVVKEPGFNYRKNLPACPDDIKAHVREALKAKTYPFEASVIDAMIKNNTTLTDSQRIQLKLAVSLAENINDLGMIVPMIVRESGADKDDNRTYFLVAGERRHFACDLLGLSQVEIKVRKGTSTELKIVRWAENFQRENPEPFEEADALYEMFEEQKAIDPTITQDAAAKKFGVSAAFMSQRLGMRKRATPELRDAVETGLVKTAQVREIATLPAKEQTTILKDLLDKKGKGEKVTAADIKDKTDSVKVEKARAKKAEKKEADEKKQNAKKGKGKEKEKEKPAAKKEPEESPEETAQKAQIQAAKDALGEKYATIEVRAKKELVAAYGLLCQRYERASTDRTKQELKGKIAMAEWVLGLRSSL